MQKPFRNTKVPQFYNTLSGVSLVKSAVVWRLKLTKNTASCQEDVLRLEIAVDDAEIMDMAEAVKKLEAVP